MTNMIEDSSSVEYCVVVVVAMAMGSWSTIRIESSSFVCEWTRVRLMSYLSSGAVWLYSVVQSSSPVAGIDIP